MDYVILAVICLVVGFVAGYLTRRNNPKDPNIPVVPIMREKK